LQNLNINKDEWTLGALGLDEDAPAHLLMASDAKSLYNFTEADARQGITKLITSDKEASIEDIAQSKAYLAGISLKNWKNDRNTKKARKAGACLQSFLCTIGDFLHSFSGVAEVVKAADQQFGGLAYGTVTLLAAVAVIKQRREESIEEVLEELAHAFPRINTLQELRPGTQLKMLVVDIFKLAITFCRETIAYFTEGKRAIKALKPSEFRMKTASQLRIKLLEVRKECEVVMLQKLEGLRLKLEEMESQLQEANVRLGELQNTSKSIEATGLDTNTRVKDNQTKLKQDAEMRARKAYLSELRGQLGLKKADDTTTTDTVNRVKELLQTGFSGNRRKLRGVPQRMTPTLLEREEVFSKWRIEKTSSMLVLSGSNCIEDASNQLSWLSYASIWAVESARRTSHTLAAFCLINYTVTDRTRVSFQTLFNSLMYQLALQHPSGLRSRGEDVNEALSSELWTHHDPLVAMGKMTQTLISLMSEFAEGESITIIVDRPDKCYWPEDNEGEVDSLHVMVSSLVDIVQEESLHHLRIKVLLVLDAHAAKFIPKRLQWAKRHGVLNWKIDWDQELTQTGDE
jgi:hypothetical protein